MSPSKAVVLAAFGVLGLTFADTLASITEGWLQVAVVVVSFAFLVVGGLGLWVQAQHNRQAGRLALDVTVQAGAVSVATIARDLDQFVEAEKEHLPTWPAPKPAKSASVELGPAAAGASALGLSLKDVLGMSADAEAGNLLNSMKGLAFAGRPDERTEADYAAEVEVYLTELRDCLDTALDIECRMLAGSRVVVTVTNTGDRVWEGVLVTLHIDGALRAALGAERPEGGHLLLGPPRAPGRPSPYIDSPMVFAPSDLSWSSVDPSGPTIDNSHSAEIAWPEMTVRPGRPVTLPPVHLITDEPLGTRFSGSWSATATNGDGMIEGRFEAVCDTEYTLADLLAAIDGE